MADLSALPDLPDLPAAPAPAIPGLQFACAIHALVEPPLSAGPGVNGERRHIVITGGLLRGPLINGSILPGGSDWLWQRPDGTAEIHAHYSVRLDDGTPVYLRNLGLRHAEPAVLARLRAALEAALDRSLSAEPAGEARLTNLSARTAAGGAAGTPIVGFVVAGAAKRVLVRGVGPALGAFGVTGVLADPALELRTTAGLVQRNDDWAGADAAAMAALGAFALPAGGKDAALLATLPPGAYTALVSDATGGAGGVALAELYDGDGAAPAGRLANASVRAAVGSGAQVLIPGLAVGGTGAAGLLIRAAGPALGRFGVADALADPVIALYRGSTLIASNDDWSGADNAAQIARAAAAAGAFGWDNGGRDAALLVTLPAGANYTVQVSGKGGATGTALVELYVVE